MHLYRFRANILEDGSVRIKKKSLTLLAACAQKSLVAEAQLELFKAKTAALAGTVGAVARG